MRDPLDELRSFTGDLSAHPLPAEEVRRRGNRLRRRRRLAQAVGAAAAVAVVVSGGAFLSGDLSTAPVPPGPAEQTSSPAPSPTAAPQPAWRTSIPDDFPIDRGLPEPGGDIPEWTWSEDASTSLNADSCRETGQETVDPVDGRQVQVDPPDAHASRHLVLFEDDTVASTMLDRARFADGLCLAQLQGIGGTDDGLVEVRWSVEEASSGPTPVVVIEGRAYAQGTENRVPGRSLTRVAQVGNALLVAHLSDASSAMGDDARTRAFASDVDGLVDDMCIFAAWGCTGLEPVDPEPLAHVLGAERLATATEISGWSAVEGLLEHPLVCASESTEALAGDRTDTRQFAVLDGGEVRAMAITTVLDFEPSAWKTDGYERAAGWLRTCTRRLDREHVVPPSEAGTPYGEVHSGETARGPWTWRSVRTTAPEICQECDAAWDHHQGVALAGDRLVLLQVSYPAELGGPPTEPQVPFLDVLSTAADLASKSLAGSGGPGMTIGPTGVADVELGTSVPELQALGLLDGDLAGCNSFDAAGERFGGFASDTEGVGWLWAYPPRSTPEGVGFESTRTQVEAAYGALRPLGWNDMWLAEVPGHPGTSYAFSFSDEVVTEIALLDDDHYCTR